MKIEYQSVDEYINSFSNEIQSHLNKIRNIILQNAPNAVESISYGMPAYKTNDKPLIYFAAYKNHIGLYATPNAHLKFAKELAMYKQGKGSVQFPLNMPIPFDLISQIVMFKANENNLKK